MAPRSTTPTSSVIALAAGFTLALATAPSGAMGWTDTGHMLVARVAMEGLKADGRGNVAEFFSDMADSLYSARNKALRGTTDNEWTRHKQDDLVGVATWEDSLAIAFDYQKPWHFSDDPVILDSGCKLQPLNKTREIM